MMSNARRYDSEAAARLLLEAWRSGELLPSLPQPLKPRTLEQGYDAQDHLITMSGGRRAGWKLGVASPAAMRQGNLSRPLIGQVSAQRCHPTGTQLVLPATTRVTIECEIAFVLDRDIPPDVNRGVDPRDVRSTCVTLEVVRSRFTDRRAVGWPSFSADNVGFEALVIGDSLSSGLDLDLLLALDESVVVHLDGRPRAQPLSGDAATDPLRSLAALYAHAADRGITLKAGELVSTGAMCEPFDISNAGHSVVARFLGRELVLHV